MNIVFACGNAFEPWDPDLAARRGVGGSELAVIEMARQLVAAGHGVRVYTNCGKAMSFSGAGDWWPTEELFAPKSPLRCDVLVLWRNAALVDCAVEARARVLWVHDVHPAHLTMERIGKIDRVIALSEWQRAVLVVQDRIPPSKIVLGGSGIDVGSWRRARVQNLTRVRHAAVYTSSPDRGLATLFALWPRIRARVPRATLGVTYGFDNAIAQATSLGDTARLAWLQELHQVGANLHAQGVTLYGRLPRANYEMLVATSGAWLYPTDYPENSPATAMEALACGLRVVTTARCGLRELVGEHGALIPGDPGSVAYQEAFVEAAAHALTAPDAEPPKVPERVRSQRYAAEHFDWRAVATKWEALFAELLAQAEPPPTAPGGATGVRWIREEDGRRVETFVHAPPDMVPHVAKVLEGEYDVPGLTFATPPRVLDLGACVGDFALWAAHRWPGARIDGYEPNPAALPWLEKNLAGLAGANIYRVAVRAQDGFAALYPGRHNLGEATLRHTVAANAAESVVECVKCVGARSLPACHVLKVDTEGCEVEILRSYFAATRARGWPDPRLLLLEFHSAADRVELDEMLVAHGYTLARGRIETADMGTLAYVRSL